MDQRQPRILIAQALGWLRSAMRRTMVDDSRTRGVRRCTAAASSPARPSGQWERSRFWLATTKDSGVMHIQGGYVGPGIASRVLMVDAHGGPWSASSCEVFAVPRLDADSCAAGCIFGTFRSHKLLKGSGLEEHHRRIVTTKIDRSPVIAPQLRIHDPEVRASIMRVWVPVR